MELVAKRREETLGAVAASLCRGVVGNAATERRGYNMLLDKMRFVTKS